MASLVHAPPLPPDGAAAIDALREAILNALSHEHSPFYADYLASTADDNPDPSSFSVAPSFSAASPSSAASTASIPLVMQALEVYARVCDDNFLHRYLRARQFDVPRACTKALASIAWHLRVRPERLRAAEFEAEARAGKVYVSGPDVHGRAILVLDSTRASVLDQGGQIHHLIWNIQRAVRRTAAGGCEKFAVFIHLEEFGWSNAPSLLATQQAIRLLGGHFPERLGHCVLYKAPYLFWTLWSMVKPLLDPVTSAKVVMISGDTADGTANNQTLVGKARARIKALLAGGRMKAWIKALWAGADKGALGGRAQEVDWAGA